MIIDGLRFMVVGMGVVFFFLTLLVAAMHCSAAFFSRYAHLFPEVEPVAAKSKKREMDDSADIAIAIVAARAATQR